MKKESGIHIAVEVNRDNSRLNCNTDIVGPCNFCPIIMGLANVGNLEEIARRLSQLLYNIVINGDEGLLVSCSKGAGITPCGQAVITRGRA